MQDLLKQLQELMPLAANATAGPWDCCPADYEGWSLIREADKQRHHEGQPEDFASLNRNADAVFLTAARNLLTEKNLMHLYACVKVIANSRPNA